MSPLHGPRALAALATAAVLALSACGSDSEQTDTSSSSASSESTSPEDSATSESTEASEDQSSDDEAEGSDDGTATAKKSGVSFDVPDGWTAVDPAEVASSGEAPEALKEMAEAQGTTTDQLLEAMKNMDLMLVGETTNDFADNVNVLASPAMPTEADLKSQLEQISAKVEGTETVETDLGEALDTTYSLSAGGTTVQGRMLAVPTDSGAAMITVSASDAGTADEVATEILESVDKA
ncbi:hypothetical protein [Janibacter indicus]|uniref:hypothetical protein n=1 Tax=Janibacter indicus TaxID=857417 RepID=UPI003EB9042E